MDGVKIEQDVELGIEDNDNVEILSGLSGGEEIYSIDGIQPIKYYLICLFVF